MKTKSAKPNRPARLGVFLTLLLTGCVYDRHASPKLRFATEKELQPMVFHWRMQEAFNRNQKAPPPQVPVSWPSGR